MGRFLKILFFGLFIKPIVLVVLGLNIRNKKGLPKKGPAVIAANHNSHLDTMVLMSLYPLSKIHKIRPVAAADYFLTNKALAWLSLNCIGIIPLDRNAKKGKQALFSGCHKALDKGDILIIFPEGSRGQPEKMSRVKTGLYHLLCDRKDTKVTPVVMHGLGKALPRGEALLVPFNCDVVIGSEYIPCESARNFTDKLSQYFDELSQFCLTKDKEF